MPQKMIQRDGKNFTFSPGRNGSLTATANPAETLDFPNLSRRAKTVPIKPDFQKRKQRQGIVNTLASTRG